MKIRYIGPHDEVEVLGQLVKRNHQAEFADSDAGTPPDPRLVEAMVELHDAIEAHDHPGAAKLRTEIVGLDHGTGLLAQDTWEAVTTSTKKKDEVDK